MQPIALVSARVAAALDTDLPPLVRALTDLGVPVEVVNWDDPDVDWSRFQQAVLRSTWDYAERLPEFLAFADRVAALTRLRNAPPVLRWNTDKHYLSELAGLGVATVPSVFAEPGADAAHALAAFRQAWPSREYVIKPAVGAGSRDAARYHDDQRTVAVAHIQRLLDDRRSVLMQPYLDRVDAAGETALLYFGGAFSHAIRKGPLLKAHAGPTELLFAIEDIQPREATAAERAVGAQVLDAMAKVPALQGLLPLPYARVDLLLDELGQPCLLELELTEPSTFLEHDPAAARRFAEVLLGS
ncbi:hypothetical protein C7S18_18175 [Ahniella affigens]|uniref:ATP-grasp domain-containing protein n=1 Tax=Ahniella affigens TaxID=2021234 RepID=A0A2P1PVX8_9GAMM|nr:hypothetical protein [Ahniella affigens]AVP98982.1 hypothetical protein C7S18_18175 [Ahniella affigens]